MEANTLVQDDFIFKNGRSFNERIFQQYPEVTNYIDKSQLSDEAYHLHIEHMSTIDQGGFDHASLSGLYTKNQNSHRYGSTRLCGWSTIFNSFLSRLPSNFSWDNRLIIDFLAGGGTLSKKLKQLMYNSTRPSVLGLDVSHRMCEYAHQSGEQVLWGSYRSHPVKKECADVAIAAYGFHHVPVNERSGFVAAMQQTLKKDGICLLHDFESGSATARWYSEAIHEYRLCGHPYEHVTQDGLNTLLSNYFNNVEIEYVYDPFYLEALDGQDSGDLKKEFFSYLIELFNLEKLLPPSVDFSDLRDLKENNYWLNIECLLSPYFTLSNHEMCAIQSQKTKLENPCRLDDNNVPLFNQLTIHTLPNGKNCLIAPRIALLGIGSSKRSKSL